MNSLHAAWKRSNGSSPRVIAHRGESVSYTENTLEAFGAAAATGAYAIELDVRLSSDGTLMVFHDPTLERLTQQRDTRPVATLSTHELTQVHLKGDARIPALLDVLALCRANGLGLNIEMKRDVPSRTDAVLETARLVRKHLEAFPIVVSSFDPFMLGGLHALIPGLPCALLLGKRDFQQRVSSAMSPVVSSALHVGHEILDDVHLRRTGAAFVNVWTVNDPQLAISLGARGVDGIITDDPGALLRVFQLA